MKQSVAAFLPLQPVFQFSRFRKRQLFAQPDNRPRTASFCPTRFPSVVLFESVFGIVCKADVKLAFAILKNVNAISCRHSPIIWLRGRDLNPRPSGYEPDELPGCSTPRFIYADKQGESKLKKRGSRILDNPAATAFRRWRFKSAQLLKCACR